MSKDTTVYAHVLQWPADEVIHLADPIGTAETTKVTMLGLAKPLSWTPKSGESGLEVSVKDVLVTEIPCEHAWVLKLEGVK